MALGNLKSPTKWRLGFPKNVRGDHYTDTGKSYAPLEGEKDRSELLQSRTRHAQLECRLPEPAPYVPCPFLEVDGC
jgi:hypothetical protein